MANGGGVVGSRAPYIIICNSRIAVRAAVNDPIAQIQAVSQGATNLVTYYGEKLSDADTKPISTIQHDMMDEVSGRFPLSKMRAEALVNQMFNELDALEEKMKS